MAYDIRPGTIDEIPALLEGMAIGFAQDVEEDAAVFGATAEMDRSRCVFDGDLLIGTSGAYSLDLTVPGGSLATGGTTWVTVRPTHRRRGVLRSMMRAHLDEVRERGEVLAALWASESSIYGRFGYGPAAYQHRFIVDTAFADFAHPVEDVGAVRLLSLDEAKELLPPLYEESRRARPGNFARSAAWWEHRRCHDPRSARRGMSPLRYALYERGGSAAGYLQYRTKPGWNEATGVPRGTLYVVELQALDAAARAALWRFALDTDLVTRVDAWNQPGDDSLPWLLKDRRRVEWTTRDSIWLRLVDLPRALEGRAYGAEGEIVFGVRDGFCDQNDGAFVLDAGPDGARCRASDRDPDIHLDVADLAAMYLGGNSFRTLAAAGRVQGSAEALARADAMFSWAPAPWCPEVF